MTSVDEVIRRQTACDPSRLEPAPGAPTMLAVVTTGNGGLERLDYREVRRPRAGRRAKRSSASWPPASTPPTINTRVGWYSAAVSRRRDAETQEQASSGGRRLGRSSPFPFIQGTDCCGRRRRGRDRRSTGACSGDGRSSGRACDRGASGRRRRSGWAPTSTAPSPSTCWRRRPRSSPSTSGLSDAELGIVPCSFGTAENMLASRRRLRADSTWSSPAPPAASARPPYSSPGCAARRSRRSPAPARRSRCWRSGAARVVDRDDDLVAALGEQARPTSSSTTSPDPASTACSRSCAAAASTSRPAPSQDRTSASTSAPSTCATSRCSAAPPGTSRSSRP